MNRSRPVFLIAAFLVVLATTGAAGEETDERAEQMLRDFSNYAASLKSFQLDAIVTQTIQMSGAISEKSGRCKVLKQQPSYLDWLVQSPTWSTEIICDGFQCQRHLSALKQYTLTPLTGRIDAEILPFASPYGAIFSAMLATNPEDLLSPARRGSARFLGMETVSNSRASISY